MSTREDFIKALHQATVEIITHINAGRDPLDSCKTIAYTDATYSIISRTQVSLSPDDEKVVLTYPIEENGPEMILGDVHHHEEDLNESEALGVSLNETSSLEQDATISPEDNPTPWDGSEDIRIYNYSIYPLPTDESFLSLSLADLDLRCAVSSPSVTFALAPPNLHTFPSFSLQNVSVL